MLKFRQFDRTLPLHTYIICIYIPYSVPKYHKHHNCLQLCCFGKYEWSEHTQGLFKFSKTKQQIVTYTTIKWFYFRIRFSLVNCGFFLLRVLSFLILASLFLNSCLCLLTFRHLDFVQLSNIKILKLYRNINAILYHILTGHAVRWWVITLKHESRIFWLLKMHNVYGLWPNAKQQKIVLTYFLAYNSNNYLWNAEGNASNKLRGRSFIITNNI